MPDIRTGSQIFDISFHPTESLVFVGLLTGGILAYSYNDEGQTEERFSIQPSKRSCRGLATSEDGTSLYAVGKGKSMQYVR
jgi:WD repeat-containing protein 55